MLIGRILTPDGAIHVRVDGDAYIPISDPYEAFTAGLPPVDLGPAVTGKVMAPVIPSMIVGLAQNGPDHPSPVQAWLKSPHTVAAPEQIVRLRRDAGQTVAEAELALVIGRETTEMALETAHEYVLGVTAVNDLSSPDRGAFDPRNFESKSGWGYTPLGPWIDTDVDLDDIAIALRINGEVAGETNSGLLPVSVRECLAYLAHWTWLAEGDVIMTGAPFTNAPIEPGDVVEVEVGGMVLRTPTR